MFEALLVGFLACLAAACVHEPSQVQPVHSPEPQPLGLKTPAPIDDEVRDLPNVSASWFEPTGSDVRLYVLELGRHGTKPPPLVLLHGVGSGGNRDFHPVLAALSSKRRVIAVDLPGFGRSERRGGDDFGPEQMVRQVASVVDALGVRRFDVLGHSSGAALALLFAAQSPKRVRRLVLLGVVGVLRPETLLRSTLHEQLNDVRASSPMAAEIVETSGDALVRAMSFLIRSPGALADTGLAGSSPGALLALALLEYNFGAAIFGTRTPTLLVWGDRDEVAPVRIAHLLEDRIPGSKLSVLKDAGHVPMQDQPAALVELVTTYLDQPLEKVSKQTLPEDPAPDTRCENQRDLTITGNYREIILEHCRRIWLNRVRAQRIVARASEVRIDHGYVTDGLVADDSELVITGGEFRGDVALDLKGGAHDVAGADIEGKVAGVRARHPASVVFSVTRIKSPKATRVLHEEMSLAQGEEL